MADVSKFRKKLKNRKFFFRFVTAAAVLLLLLGASVYSVWVKPNLNQERYIYIEETVQKGNLILGIMESGNILLEETSLDYSLELDMEEEDENSGEDGDEEEAVKYLEIEAVYVVSGQRIEQGNALFKLTEKSVEAVKKRLHTLFTEAQIALAEAEAEYKIEVLQAKRTYDTSILEAKRASSSYQAASTQTQERANRILADIKVLQAEMEYYEEQLADEDLWDSLEEAQTAYTEAKNRFDETDVHNATAYAGNYTEYKSAKQQLENIQSQIEDLQEGIADNQKSMEEKQKKLGWEQSSLEVEELTNQSAYESAVLSGELAQDIYNYTVDSLEKLVNSAQVQLESAENNLKKFQDFVGDDGVIYADGSGLVTNVSYEAGDDLVMAGSMLTYVKEDAYTVTIDVSEEDITAITVGNKVEIVMSAYPDVVYEGTIVSITAAATSDYVSTISYPVTIFIEGDTSLLYGGMTAAVTLVTDSAEDVLYVSKRAIVKRDEKSYVYTKGKSGSRELAEVETGFTDGTSVEIVSGLSEGDTIYIKSRISGSEAELMERTSKAEEQTGSKEMPKEGMGVQSGGMPEEGTQAQGGAI